LSATGINLTVIVEGDEVNAAIERLHREFFGTGALQSNTADREGVQAS